MRKLFAEGSPTVGTFANPIDIEALPFTSDAFNVSPWARYHSLLPLPQLPLAPVRPASLHGWLSCAAASPAPHALTRPHLLLAVLYLQATQTIEQAGNCPTAPVAGLVFR